LIEVLNKIDLLPPQVREALVNRAERANAPTIALSAITGEGCERLLVLLDGRLGAGAPLLEISLPPEDGASLAWLYSHGEVVERQDSDEKIHLKVRLDAADAARFARRREQRPA
jgi:GTP-binding protein HflX